MVFKKFMDMEGVCEYTTLSKTVIYRLIKEADFPRPFGIQGVEKRVVWSVNEVDEWFCLNTRKQVN